CMNTSSMIRGVVGVQGVFYFLTGVWPLIHLESFLWVTGPKTDLWLVQTVGLLVTAVSLPLLAAWKKRRFPAETLALAAVCLGRLTAIDIIFVDNVTLLPVYLLDAAAEIVFFLPLSLALAFYFRLNPPSGRV